MTTDAAGREYELGVLFVHGIGRQERGETLIQWGDSIVGWLQEWGEQREPRLTATFTSAALAPSTESPAYGVLELEAKTDRVRWLAVECWWAGEFAVPSFRELSLWSLNALPTVAIDHAFGGVTRNLIALRQRHGIRRVRPVANLFAAFPGLLLALGLSPVLVLLMLLLFLAGLVPIARVRSWVAAVQRGLTSSIGDSMVLLRSPVQRAAMTSRVLSEIDYLNERRCAAVAVVAHSQGAAVALDALQRVRDTDVSLFVTLGSGIKKLEKLRRRPTCGSDMILKGTARRSLRPAASARRSASAAWGPPVVLAITAFLALAVKRQIELGTFEAGLFLRILLGFVVASMVLAVIAKAVIRLGSVRSSKPILTVSILVLATGATVWINALDAAWVWPAFFILWILPLLSVRYLSSQLSEAGKPLPMGVPKRVGRWVDLTAWADPVSDGPTRLEDERRFESVEVHNFDSVLTDHSSYRRAWTDALALVVRELLGVPPGQFRLTEAEDRRLDAARIARQRRVAWLVGSRWVAALATLAFLITNRQRLGQIATTLADLLPDSSPRLTGWASGVLSSIPAETAALAAIFVGGFATYLLLVGVWRLWDRDETVAFFSPGDGGMSRWPNVLAGLCSFALLGSLTAPMVAEIIGSAANEGLGSGLLLIMGIGGFFALPGLGVLFLANRWRRRTERRRLVETVDAGQAATTTGP